MSLKISIYQVFHKNAQTLQNKFLIPIQVGTGESLSCECVRDNQGDEISRKNGSYCELTAQYWAWKNDKVSEYLGIMHYRRVFDFSNFSYSNDVHGVIVEQSLGLDFEAKYGYFDENIESFVSKYDIVLPKMWSVRNIGFKSLKEHYIKAPFHIESHLQITQDAVKELYPEYLSDFQIVLDGHEGYFTNMFVMKREYFEKYSQWLFDILSLVESKVSLDGLNIQEKRVFGYLSERLLNVWIAHEKRTNLSLKIGTLDRVFVENTDVKEFYNYVNLPTSNVVSAVIASDNNYVPHLGALIQSICTFFDSKYFLDLIILDGGITEENRRLLTLLVKESSINSKITFCDLSDQFLNLGVHMHFSRATFYRLVLDTILPQHKKVLYIDCDTIVNDDIATLYFEDLEEKSIGACFDYIMHHFCQIGVPSHMETGSLHSKQYLQEYVGLSNRWNKYFQAGVILFDLEKVRKKDIGSKMILDLLSKKYWFLDQDILNKYFQNDVHFINPAWNNVNVGTEIFKGLTEEHISELIEAGKAPKLIHYAGYEAKPWVNNNAPFSNVYFKFLRQTYWYEQVYFKIKSDLQDKRVEEFVQVFENNRFKITKKVWQNLPYPIKRVLNPFKEKVKNILSK